MTWPADVLEQQRQQRLAERLAAREHRRQKRKLLRQMMRAKVRNQRASEQELYEELVARSIARMFTRSLTMEALTNRMTPVTTTTTESAPESPQDSPPDSPPDSPQESQTDSPPDANDMDNMCHDIRGRDRACCNTALTCFEDVANVIDDLDNAPNDYTLLSACRKVSDELKRDRVCVKQGLSGCDGTGKAVLQRRFDNRINNLYDQFYKHCRGRTVKPPTSSTEINNTPTPLPITTSQSTLQPVSTVRTTTSGGLLTGGAGNGGTYTSNPGAGSYNTQPTAADAGGGIDPGLIIVGAVTGGAILVVMLIIILVLWCRNRKDRYDSDGSAGSLGVFFQKRPSGPPSDRPTSNNNNKPAATRQDSTVYAEIDEHMVSPGYKPPLPSDMTNAGYLHPIGDTGEAEEDHYNQPDHAAANAPMATTRGQLSYGPILAANSNSNSNTNSVSDSSLFYYSTSLTPPAGRQHGRELPSIPTGQGAANNRSLFTSKPHIRKDNSYVECHGDVQEDLDEYEEPVSAQSSVKYSEVHRDMSPPYEPAPGIPVTAAKTSPENKHHKMAVKVLPPNPFKSEGGVSPLKSASNPNTPIAKPRRKKTTNGQKQTEDEKESATINEEQKRAKSLELDLTKLQVSNRDSNVSDSSVKSFHHYFVLEPDGGPKSPLTPPELGYENAVSSSKLV